MSIVNIVVIVRSPLLRDIVNVVNIVNIMDIVNIVDFVLILFIVEDCG